MSSAPVVLCVGEPLIVLSPNAGESLEATSQLHVSIGGAEANVAVHLARLGVSVRFAGRVGADPFGKRVQTALSAEGVDVRALDVDAHRPTGLYAKDPIGSATVAYYYRRDSASSALTHLSAAAVDGVGHVHVSGVLASLSGRCAALIDELVDGRLPVSFDVNHRPALWADGDGTPPATVLLDLARRADVVFVGLDEAGQLWGCRDAAAVRAILPDVELVVKDAERPAVGFRNDERVEVAALPVPVIEPVGAGDAFAAGYLAARLGDGDLARALRTGHAVAAGALSTHGDQGVGTDPALLRAATTGEGWPSARGTAAGK
jgi:2-dehydro-3-deoxygluconokinase